MYCSSHGIADTVLGGCKIDTLGSTKSVDLDLDLPYMWLFLKVDLDPTVTFLQKNVDNFY